MPDSEVHNLSTAEKISEILRALPKDKTIVINIYITENKNISHSNIFQNVSVSGRDGFTVGTYDYDETRTQTT
nr:MAG TPA: hypothetical protein [Caudoviricetes sp.]